MAANSRFAVAVHATALLAHRAARGEEWVSSSQIAASVRTNPVVVRRALSALARSGVLRTRGGRRGGASLARGAGEISLADIYRAVAGLDGVLAPNPNPTNRTCAVSSGMSRALTPIIVDVEEAVERTLARVTVAEVLGMIEPPHATAQAGKKL